MDRVAVSLWHRGVACEKSRRDCSGGSVSQTPGATLDEAAPEAEGLDEPELRQAHVPDAMHGQRLDKLLVTLAPEFSRSHLQALIVGGHVQVDGRVRNSASVKVVAGQHVALELVPTAQSQAFCAQAQPIVIVFEDPHLLVLDKRAGWVVHPAAGNWSGTVLNALLAHHRGAASLPRAGIVHRLDKDTSGLMVVAKTQPAFTALVRAIAAREVHRQYRAIAHGEVAAAPFSVEAPIGRDSRVRVRMAVTAQGKAARTDVERLGFAAGHSALQCTLHSGRTHQIRVHLASIGHALVGDAVYGGRPALGLQRQALHALRLAFLHPITGQPLSFEADPPPDFAHAWKSLIEAAGAG
jgi:23S rRNA pseudouridine1911/1915/1917 synthase